MSAILTPIDPGITNLADHLDAALATGEDLLAETTAAADDDATDTADALASLVRALRRHEASLVARVLQARRCAAGLVRPDAATRTLAGLFLANTKGLVDIIDQFGDRAAGRFETGDDPTAFLRSRTVIAADAAAAPRFTALSIADTYRVAGTIELGPLLDLVAALLDALDLRHDLYAPAEPEGVSETLVASAPDDTIAPTAEAATVTANPSQALTPGSLAAALDTLRTTGEPVAAPPHRPG